MSIRSLSICKFTNIFLLFNKYGYRLMYNITNLHSYFFILSQKKCYLFTAYIKKNQNKFIIV